MFISDIQIQNFKTFNDLSVELDDFNVLIGACASGKTNFVEVFEFLRDLSQNFHKGVKKHGGAYIRNFNLNDGFEKSHLKVSFKKNTGTEYFVDLNGSIGLKNEIIKLSFNKMDYEIDFKFNINGCDVLNEKVLLYCNVTKENKVFENMIQISNDGGKISAEFAQDMPFLKIQDIIPDNICDIVENNFKNDNIPVINSPLSSIPINWGGFFNNIFSYDFDPKLLKDLNNMSDEVKLTKFGSNLPVVLNNILEDDIKREEFISFLTNLLPYIKAIDVEKILDEERIFLILEKYNDVRIPSPFVSDGTSLIIAIIIVLFFQNEKIIFLEEPERHIHPSLIAKLILMIKSVQDKQVVITTHNPELLKHVNLEDILYISRDSLGFSNMMKLCDNDAVKPFIDEFGIDDVFVNDYLGLNYD